MRAFLAPILGHAGYRTLTASGGREGIAQAQQHLPNRILLALTMPDVSGFDVIATLRGDVRTREIPILVMTAKDLTAEERAFLEKSVQGVSQKHATLPQTLVEQISQALAPTHRAPSEVRHPHL